MKVDTADQARTSITSFYQKYRNLIFKKSNETANAPDYADVLVQDTLYQLLRREELFLSLSETQQAGYCMKTIRNTALNHHKRNQKIRFLSEDILGKQSNPSPPWRKRSCVVQITLDRHSFAARPSSFSEVWSISDKEKEKIS